MQANLRFTAYTPDAHGGGATSTSIAEGQDGSLFIANESGLLKFDGVNWHRMPATGHTNYISSVAIDHNNLIWISSLTTIGYYALNSEGNYDYTDITHTIQKQSEGPGLGTFWKLYAENDKIYLITNELVLEWNGKQWKRRHFDVERRILTNWIENTLYVHVRGTGLFRLDNEDFTLIAKDTPEVASGIISIIESSDKGLLCATVDNGFHLLKDHKFISTDIEWRTSQILHAELLRDETIAVSTTHDGIIIVDKKGGLIGQVNHDKSAVYNSLEHSSGSIWAATTSTIIEIPTPALSCESDKALDIVEHKGALYYTNGNELKAIDRTSTGRWSTKTIARGFDIWDLQSTERDLLYGDSQSLGTITPSGRSQKIPSPRHVSYLFESYLDKSLIYTGDAPQLSRWQDTTSGWQYLDSLNDFNSSALSVVELPNSKLLISSENNPLLLVDWQATATTTKLGKPHGLPDKFIWAHFLRDGNSIIAITNKGLFCYDSVSNKFHYDPALGNNLGTDAYALESCSEASGNGWILNLSTSGENHQIGHLKQETKGTFNWSPLQLPSVSAAGKVESLFHEKTKDSHEILWVGGSSKLLRYDLDSLPDLPPPTTRLSSISEQDSNHVYFNGVGSPAADLEWQYPQKALIVKFVAPPSPIKIEGYQTRLLGFQDNWTKPSEATYREFTNLPHGDYTFQVQAIDEFERAGIITDFSFTIRTPWYLTPFAYLGYALSAIIILGFSNHWRNRTLRVRNEQLESLVNTRTHELETQKLQLLKANKAKQNFLASMSHEIRNPLNGIIGIARLLKQKEEKLGIQSEETTHLYSCSHHLNQLLSQTLDYSSLEAGKLRTRFEPFDPCELLLEVIQIQSGMAQEKGIRLELERPNIKHNWKGDPVLLRQILINLISNGIKYTNQGSVSLILNYKETEELASACFEVVDTGPGVPLGHENMIFEEFTRLPESEMSHIPGTGLGLTISSEMARLMGGSLTLDTKHRTGARFLLNLEFEIEQFRRKHQSDTEQNQSDALKGKRVLIADDMEFNRYISTAVLTSMGAEIDEAENGLIAFNKLNESNYDFALLDINMPEMSGLEVVEAFLKSHQGDTPEFFALSAYNTPDVEEKCMAAGFNQFIEKPLDPEKLKKKLKHHYNRSTPPIETSLLDYLAKNGPKSLEELQAEYGQSFKEELDELSKALAENNQKEQNEIIHKLLGLCRVQKHEVINDLVEKISVHSKQGAPKEELASLIEQVSAQINEVLNDSK
ncbi:hybrid sensor histidine kinase/response regulator [Coraliomargarita sp. W4R72]